jgi:hypothetical protein
MGRSINEKRDMMDKGLAPTEVSASCMAGLSAPKSLFKDSEHGRGWLCDWIGLWVMRRAENISDTIRECMKA